MTIVQDNTSQILSSDAVGESPASSWGPGRHPDHSLTGAADHVPDDPAFNLLDDMDLDSINCSLGVHEARHSECSLTHKLQNLLFRRCLFLGSPLLVFKPEL